MTDETLTAGEIAARLALPPSVVRSWIARREITSRGTCRAPRRTGFALVGTYSLAVAAALAARYRAKQGA